MQDAWQGGDAAPDQPAWAHRTSAIAAALEVLQAAVARQDGGQFRSALATLEQIAGYPLRLLQHVGLPRTAPAAPSDETRYGPYPAEILTLAGVGSAQTALRPPGLARARLLTLPERGAYNLAHSVWTGRLQFEYSLAVPGLFPRPTQTIRAEAGVFLPTDDNVFHLIMETLPRLAVAATTPKHIPLYIAADRVSPHYLAMLSAFDLAGRERIACPPGAEVVFETLVFADTFDTSRADVFTLDPGPLDEAIVHLTRDVQPSGPERIYVSRRDATARAFDEAPFEEVAMRYGFTVLTLSGRTLTEQLALFRNVRIVAGPHGQGISNVAWARPGCRVVELNVKTGDRALVHIARLCAARGHHYTEVAPRPDGFAAEDFEAALRDATRDA